ncbi:DUF3784 domain-containing protein [Anaerofustis sp. LCP19S3_F7]|uniref:DUF3784 domain-containing protein n=1 Tax=Anaerofustis sp. LCP19S3_F7 TaxID=3440247 RepID=UPI003F929CD7
MNNIISIFIVLILFLICLTISILQLSCKGPLLNNAYLFASKKERENMNKKPHYRQTGIVFLFLSAIFLCLLINIIFKIKILGYIRWCLILCTILYALVSSIKLYK